jgi:predicted aspartyl protease
VGKKLVFVFALIFCSLAELRSQEFVPDPHLKALIDSGEFFQFRKEFESKLVSNNGDPDVITPENMYFFAWDYFLFNKSELSNTYINSFLDTKGFEPGDSITAEVLQLHFQNDIRLFNYKSADSICTLLLFRYASVIGPATLTNIRNTGKITAGLVNIAPQTIERTDDLNIVYKRDLVNLIRIPVTMNAKTEDFIFDTGANFSTINETEAERMGVEVLNVEFSVTTSSRSALKSKLGVAKTLVIGNVTFRNVVFIILPDKALKFAGGLYKIKGIVGLPVIAQLKHIEITKDHIHATANFSGELREVNFGLEGNTPFVSVTFFGIAHNYIFDTGAAASALGNRFNDAYKDSLVNAEDGSARIGGAGGVQKIKTRKAKDVHYSLGKTSGVLKSLSIQMSGITDVLGNYYGIVGQDIFMPWEVMMIDFDKMYVELK